MLETYALYSTDLSDHERELGFELLEITNSSENFGKYAAVQAVAYRFSEVDQIVKMNVPVIGGHSYRHERLRPTRTGEASWSPASAFVFPTAEQALNSIQGLQAAVAACR